jgi:hypothetical protein
MRDVVETKLELKMTSEFRTCPIGNFGMTGYAYELDRI